MPLFRALLVSLVASAVWTGASTLAAAQDPTEFLTQMVCVDGTDYPTVQDPYDCPASRRKLRVGEPLPYHKWDGVAQISDSFPISDENGLSRGVQTYYFTDANGRDPLFPATVHFDPVRGGYNIIGADSNFVFFRGTSDPGAYWQPWWTSVCQAKGWLLFPNNSSAFSYGGAPSPTTFAPQCSGSTTTAPQTVEWTMYSAFAFRDAANPSSIKYMDALAAYAFAPGYGALEISYFTREYGVTRFESWRPGTGAPSTAVQTQCPGVAYHANFHGSDFVMKDCRSWTSIRPLNGARWDPNGSPSGDPTVKNWNVDPIYTSKNYLANTTPAQSSTDSSVCNQSAWFTVNSPSNVFIGRHIQSNGDPDDYIIDPVTGELQSATWIGNGNCVPMIHADGLPSGAYAQTIAAPPPSAQPYRFGAVMLAPGVGTGSAQAHIQVIQRDAVGNLTGSDTIAANVIQYTRPFEGEFVLNPATTQIIFAVYPQQAGLGYAITQTYIAK